MLVAGVGLLLGSARGARLAPAPGVLLAPDSPEQSPLQELKRLLPGSELTPLQADYFKRREEHNAGFPGAECWSKCQETPGKCERYCAEDGFWTGSCCKYGASGKEQAEECAGRGCMGFHCCVADAITNEEEEELWNKRASKHSDQKRGLSDEQQQEQQQQQQQQGQQQQAQEQGQQQEQQGQQQQEQGQDGEQSSSAKGQQEQEQTPGARIADDAADAQHQLEEAQMEAEGAQRKAMADAVPDAPLEDEQEDAPAAPLLTAPTPVPLAEVAVPVPVAPAIPSLPANSGEPGNAEERQHELEEAQREAEKEEAKRRKEAQENEANVKGQQDAIKALNPPELQPQELEEPALASAAATAQDQQRKLEEAQMEAEEKQRKAQQEYEKNEEERKAKNDADREEKNDALKKAAKDAYDEAKEKYGEADTKVANGECDGPHGCPEDELDEEGKPMEDPFADVKRPSGHHKWVNSLSRDMLHHSFLHAKPSNNLSEVGLLIHCFDATEDFAQPWRPCNKGACWQFSKWWSASIINAKQKSTFSNSGILLTPEKNEVLCSWPSDFGSMNAGCKWSTKPHVWQPFDKDHTKDMLTYSMDPESVGNKGAEKLNTVLYNEVLIDSKNLMKRLPRSIAAFVFFDDDEYDHTKPYTPLPDKIVATTAYLAMLNFYKLEEKDIPLLQINRTAGTFMDVSGGARRFLELHSFEKYKKRHPYYHDEWLRRNAHTHNESRQQRADIIKRLGRSLGSEVPQFEPPPVWDPYSWLERYWQAQKARSS